MKLSSIWQEFKAFAFKGNMIDLAVAVVIGAAFGGVINSLVKDIIMPSISYVTTGATSAAHKAAEVAQSTASAVGVTSKPSDTQSAETQPAQAAPPAPPQPSTAAATGANPGDTKDEKKGEKTVDFTWTIGRIRIGNFIAELLNFLLIAFAVFIVIVKLLGSVMKRVGSTPAPSEPTTKECPFCLSVIPIKARKCANCTADLPASTTVAPAGPANP